MSITSMQKVDVFTTVFQKKSLRRSYSVFLKKSLISNYVLQRMWERNRFFCKVIVNGKCIGEGWGRSRKDSEQEAAKFALKQIKY